MKVMKKILTSVLVLTMLFSLSSVDVFAAETSDEIKKIERLSSEDVEAYTVTLYAGNRGLFNGIESVTVSGNENASIQLSADNETIVITNLNGDESITVTVNEKLIKIKPEYSGELNADGTPKYTTEINGVEVKNETYFPKGLSESGKQDIKNPYTFDVNGDADYVIAYEIAGKQVSYTVKYQDTQGNTLAKDDTFYGNIGDKPVVAYKYINGYAPTVFAYTKTLSETPSENVFTFVYDKVPTQSTKEVVTEETEYNYVTVGGETIIVNGGGTASNVTGGGAGAGGDADADAEDAAGAGEETVIPGIDESEIVDLDDEETPLANVEVDGDSAEDSSSSVGVYTALGILAVIIVAVVAYIVSKKKKIQE